MIHQRKADEASGREELIAKQWVLSGPLDILHQQRLARGGDAAGNPFADTNAHAVENVRGNPACRCQVQVVRFRGEQHQRTPLCLHIIAHQRQHAIHKEAWFIGRGVKRQQSVHQIQRSRALAEGYAATVQFDVRELQHQAVPPALELAKDFGRTNAKYHGFVTENEIGELFVG